MKISAIALTAFAIVPTPASSEPSSVGLSDPDRQPKFSTSVPNPLDPSFLYNTSSGFLDVSVSAGVTDTGLLGVDGQQPVPTPVWGYGMPDEIGYTWPGRTFQVQANEVLHVKWHNKIAIADGYLLTGKNNLELGNFDGQSVVDTSFHWAYSIPGYQKYTIEEHGTPIVPHLHGGHTDAPSDGNPEYFFSSEFGVKGPQWVNETYTYDNTQKAGCLWYHDHALGITRLNVYAGMAGFYIVRDELDTGKVDNPLQLPAFPYELPLAIQDRMFKETGELFYPSFKGDPFYTDFIMDEGAQVNDDDPSALAEMFGDHMVVNGKIWPKADVEPRKYRLRLLNGCDSRFLVVQLVAGSLNETSALESGQLVPFTVIGGDQGLVTSDPKTMDTLVFEPAGRYDIIVDFAPHNGRRLILKNLGGDEPFGGEIPGPRAFNHTDKVMAFDVVLPFDENVPDDFDPKAVVQPKEDLSNDVTRVRRLGLFEGHDQFGRLQPLLGTVDPATDEKGNPIFWPDTESYRSLGIVGQMKGTNTWHSPTTELVNLGDVEEWEIWNLSADAHPIHLHMVQFELVHRTLIHFDSNANEDGEIELHEGMNPAGDGTYTFDVPLMQHDNSLGEGYSVANPTKGEMLSEDDFPEYVMNMPRDVVVALPGQVTTIRARFDKPGRFNWHCHILAHEDHEMMRVFNVVDPEDDYEEGAIPAALPKKEGANSTAEGSQPIYLNPPISGGETAAIVMSTLALLLSLGLVMAAGWFYLEFKNKQETDTTAPTYEKIGSGRAEATENHEDSDNEKNSGGSNADGDTYEV